MDSETQNQLFRKSLPKQVILQQILKMIGETKDKTCLEIGNGDPVVSSRLRARGGTWFTLTQDEDTRALLLDAVNENVQVFDGKTLPFDDKTFDIIVIHNVLEHIETDDEIVTECHRVAKSPGTLVVNVPHAMPWSLVHGLRSMLGIERGMTKLGYTEAELFQLLKHGFDVHQVRSYSRAFVEIIDAIVQAKVARLISLGGQEESILKLYRNIYPLYWLAYQLDAFLFLAKGHNLIATAKRHTWRSRTAPVLNDGRTLSDVVLRKLTR